jgi:PAS domain S-box-containing protein
MPEPTKDTSEGGPSGFLSPELLLAAIVDSSDDAIVSKDLNGVVTSWNKGAQRIFGYSAEEMVGQPILKLLPKDRQSEETHILERLRRGERVDHYETVRVRKDGSQVDVSLTISPIRNASGVVVGASKIARDVTEQKQAMRKLAEAHETVERANRMKIEFISTLSHELRTPLTSIVGWIQMLKEGDPNRDELQQGLEVIERNVRVQAQLINDLLDMSRIEAGKMSLDVQQVNLVGAVKAAMETVQPAANAKGVRLIATFGSINGTLMGDKNRLQQIVWNLLTNAIKFTPKGGRVHVTVQRVSSHLEVAVSDTGTGIAPEYIRQIFERFSQADSSTTRRHGGLGLGLSIAKHLAELHGGTISATSEGIGTGATFRLTLPLLPAHQRPGDSASQQRSTEVDRNFLEEDLKGVKVLVVEDDADSAEVIRRILTRRGASVSIGHSMSEGLSSFEISAPDVILSDIGMPEYDGYEFIKRLRARPEGQRVPAVALTALARTEDRTRALRAGFQMHVAKPVDAAELIAVVRNLANLRTDPT